MRDVGHTQVLERAAELVEAGWTRSAPARDKGLQAVPVMDETATYFCAQGAMIRAARELFPDAWALPLSWATLAFTEQIGMKSIPYWQDNEYRTLGEVRECFKRAIIESTPMMKKEAA